MIKYEWRTEFSADEAAELSELLDRAAEFDAESEHNTIAFADIAEDLARGVDSVRNLLIWMLPHAATTDARGEPERIAGIARLVLSSPTSAELTVVIAPRHRSIGILTLLLEQGGADTEAPEGWLGSGVRCLTAWARGNHPATGRISNRFLIPRTRRVWKLVRPVSPGEVSELCPADGDTRDLVLREDGRVLGVMTLELDPAKTLTSPEFGPCATIENLSIVASDKPATGRRLLDGAAAAAGEKGFSAVVIHVDADDATLVNACRLTGFQHDRTDVRYELGDCR